MSEVKRSRFSGIKGKFRAYQEERRVKAAENNVVKKAEHEQYQLGRIEGAKKGAYERGKREAYTKSSKIGSSGGFVGKATGELSRWSPSNMGDAFSTSSSKKGSSDPFGGGMGYASGWETETSTKKKKQKNPFEL